MPAFYSDELYKVISCMLNVDQSRRPSVEQLMMQPRVCYHIKLMEVKKREKDLRYKEKDLKVIEQAVRDKQSQVAQK